MKGEPQTNDASQSQSASSHSVSPWCNSLWKQGLDFAWAGLLLIALSPLILAVAVAVKVTSAGPVFFRQRRPGKNGKEFLVLKFRTMFDSRPEAGPVLTRSADPRVTPLGRYMRKWKLDELPQLINVLCGQMSFVGPRPQPTKLWNQPTLQKEASCVLSVRPGITGQATINFRNEEEILAPLSAEEVEEVYMKAIMPLKLKIDVEYLQNATFGSDLAIIARTALRVFNRREGTNDQLIKKYLPMVEK